VFGTPVADPASDQRADVLGLPLHVGVGVIASEDPAHQAGIQRRCEQLCYGRGGRLRGVIADEMADFVQGHLALMNWGEARFVDDEVLSVGLDQQAVRASQWQVQAQDLEGPLAKSAESLAQTGDGELLSLGQFKRADALFATLLEVAVTLAVCRLPA
jgi:hypothetical protein